MGHGREQPPGTSPQRQGVSPQGPLIARRLPPAPDEEAEAEWAAVAAAVPAPPSRAASPTPHFLPSLAPRDVRRARGPGPALQTDGRTELPQPGAQLEEAPGLRAEGWGTQHRGAGACQPALLISGSASVLRAPPEPRGAGQETVPEHKPHPEACSSLPLLMRQEETVRALPPVSKHHTLHPGSMLALPSAWGAQLLGRQPPLTHTPVATLPPRHSDTAASIHTPQPSTVSWQASQIGESLCKGPAAGARGGTHC